MLDSQKNIRKFREIFQKLISFSEQKLTSVTDITLVIGPKMNG